MQGAGPGPHPAHLSQAGPHPFPPGLHQDPHPPLAFQGLRSLPCSFSSKGQALLHAIGLSAAMLTPAPPQLAILVLSRMPLKGRALMLLSAHFFFF